LYDVKNSKEKNLGYSKDFGKTIFLARKSKCSERELQPYWSGPYQKR
jgi:hypothetical protein